MTAYLGECDMKTFKHDGKTYQVPEITHKQRQRPRKAEWCVAIYPQGCEGVLCCDCLFGEDTPKSAFNAWHKAEFGGEK